MGSGAGRRHPLEPPAPGGSSGTGPRSTYDSSRLGGRESLSRPRETGVRPLPPAPGPRLPSPAGVTGRDPEPWSWSVWGTRQGCALVADDRWTSGTDAVPCDPTAEVRCPHSTTPGQGLSGPLSKPTLTRVPPPCKQERVTRTTGTGTCSRPCGDGVMSSGVAGDHIPPDLRSDSPLRVDLIDRMSSRSDPIPYCHRAGLGGGLHGRTTTGTAPYLRP